MTNLFNKIRQYISENRDYIDRDETIADFIIKNCENNTDGYEFWLGNNPSEDDIFDFKFLIIQEYDKTIWEVYSGLYYHYEGEILQSIKDMCYRTDYEDGWLDYIYSLKNDMQEYYELVKFLVDINGYFTI